MYDMNKVCVEKGRKGSTKFDIMFIKYKWYQKNLQVFLVKV